MADYIELLKADLAEQFKSKPVISALLDAVGKQLNDIWEFYTDLKEKRSVGTAIGRQLDGIGDIVVLSRKEAGELACTMESVFVLTDEEYRQFLIYKIWKNCCTCTYYDIIKSFQMFWNRPLYYTEDPEQPATMIFDTGEMQGNVDTRPLFRTPLIRAAGVTLKLYARTSTELDTCKIRLLSGLGYAMTETRLPVLERDYQFDTEIGVRTGYMQVTESRLPAVERDYDFTTKIRSGSVALSVTETPIGGVEIRN